METMPLFLLADLPLLMERSLLAFMNLFSLSHEAI